jgi:integrase
MATKRFRSDAGRVVGALQGFDDGRRGVAAGTHLQRHSRSAVPNTGTHHAVSGELCGLQIRDVALPTPSLNPNARTKPGVLKVERTVQRIDGELGYTTPKTTNSRRRVPLTAATTALLRDYLEIHPRRNEPTAPLFPGMRLTVPRPTGVKNDDDPNEILKVPGIEPGSWRIIADRNTTALANLSVDDAEARLVLDWASVPRHMTLYKAVYRPAILRANRLTPTAKIDPETVFHSLRHTYVSLAVAAGISAMEISRFVGHSKVTTTLGIYAHLFESDHSEAMTALGAMAESGTGVSNVIALRR